VNRDVRALVALILTLDIILLIAFWACAILGVDELLDYVRVP